MSRECANGTAGLGMLMNAREARCGPSLVALNESSSDALLFCVHTISGQVSTYRELAAVVAPEMKVLCFEAPGLRGDAEPIVSVESMAAHYVRQLREFLPNGPYTLCGYSTGGIVAYEMAQQLDEAGVGVRHLALVDAGLFPERLMQGLSRGEWLHRGVWIAFIYIVFRHVDRALWSGAHPFWRLKQKEKLRHLHCRLPHESKSQFWKSAPFHALKRYFLFYKTQWAAVRRDYVPRSYSGHITYFEAEQGADRASKFLWSELTAGRCAVVPVPGEHLTLMYQPYVDSLARSLVATVKHDRRRNAELFAAHENDRFR